VGRPGSSSAPDGAGVGTVDNAGSIHSTGAYAIFLGGGVTNRSTGTITGTGYGVRSNGGVYIANMTSASIGGDVGVLVSGGAGTLRKAGTISGGSTIIDMAQGGYVTNTGNGTSLGGAEAHRALAQNLVWPGQVMK
jgi:hypothetical protein